jgi:hypothetical protein
VIKEHLNQPGKMLCLPKEHGGLGILDLSLQNEELLLKNLHKFFNKVVPPSVKVIWHNYYTNGRLPGITKKGSFWWIDILKLLDKCKWTSFPYSTQ